MDDDYALMSEDYKIIDNNRNTSITFFSTTEMDKDMSIRKENIQWNDVSGDPKDFRVAERQSNLDMKQIRKTRSVDNDLLGNNDTRYQDHLARSTNVKRRQIDYMESPQSPEPLNRRQIRPSEAIQRQFYRNVPQYIDQDLPEDDNSFCSGGVCNLKPVKQIVDYTRCPICDQQYVQTCNCMNHDSICVNKHSWHVKNGKLKLGLSHQ